MPVERLAELPSVFDRSGGSQKVFAGPLAAEVRSRWPEVVASPQALASPEVLTHYDFWSGNVDEDELRRRHARWTARLQERA